MVDNGTSLKLPGIETHAVVEQQLDVARNQTTAELVDGPLDFRRYLVKTAAEQCLLLVAEMQCLSRRVVEKRIVLDALPQRRAPYKVGMEKQSASFRFESRLHIDFDHLPRSETCDRAFLIVVGLATVADVAAARLFQKQSIYAVVHCEMRGKTCGVGKVDNSHQRMACFQAEQTVVTVYRVDLKDFRIHKAESFCCCKNKHICHLRQDGRGRIRKKVTTIHASGTPAASSLSAIQAVEHRAEMLGWIQTVCHAEIFPGFVGLR